jgi:hypothetical protein
VKAKTNKSRTVSHLMERGWTYALIRRFLGDPDQVMRNPHHPTRARTRLYDAHRVRQAEASAEFRAAQDRRKGKRDVAQKAPPTKTRKSAE